MNLCDKISSAKCCVVNIAEAYVKARTFGNDTEQMLNEYLLLNSYVDALENYDTSDHKIVKKDFLLADSGILLVDGNKILSLGSAWVKDQVCADDINCLSESDICSILQQISIVCDSCICGC